MGKRIEYVDFAHVFWRHRPPYPRCRLMALTGMVLAVGLLAFPLTVFVAPCVADSYDELEKKILEYVQAEDEFRAWQHAAGSDDAELARIEPRLLRKSDEYEHLRKAVGMIDDIEKRIRMYQQLLTFQGVTDGIDVSAVSRDALKDFDELGKKIQDNPPDSRLEAYEYFLGLAPLVLTGMLPADLPNYHEIYFGYFALLLDECVKRDTDASVDHIERLSLESHAVSATEHIDMNEDGIAEHFLLGGRGPFRGYNYVLTDLDGHFRYMELSNAWAVKIHFVYKSAEGDSRLVLYTTVGGGGGGKSNFHLLAFDASGFVTCFTGPGSSLEGIEVKDLDEDSQPEVICDDEVKYNQCYWRSIWKWDGRTMRDVSLEYPEMLIEKYKGILDQIGNARELADKYILVKGPEYKMFWEKKLRPLMLKSQRR